MFPLKNYHKGYMADPNGTRDSPLVPKGTAADTHRMVSFMRTYTSMLDHVESIGEATNVDYFDHSGKAFQYTWRRLDVLEHSWT